jgi:hypothetical protein
VAVAAVANGCAGAERGAQPLPPGPAARPQGCASSTFAPIRAKAPLASSEGVHRKLRLGGRKLRESALYHHAPPPPPEDAREGGGALKRGRYPPQPQRSDAIVMPPPAPTPTRGGIGLGAALPLLRRRHPRDPPALALHRNRRRSARAPSRSILTSIYRALIYGARRALCGGAEGNGGTGAPRALLFPFHFFSGNPRPRTSDFLGARPGRGSASFFRSRVRASNA